jgi:hypothetical protein
VWPEEYKKCRHSGSKKLFRERVNKYCSNSPFFTDGVFSPEEREQIKAYEARLFDDSGHLLPGAMPRFIPPGPGERVGKVV